MRVLLPSTRRQRTVLVVLTLSIASLFVLWNTHDRSEPELTIDELAQTYPLAWKHIHFSSGHGGAWYIPSAWSANKPEPRNIVEAAQRALAATNSTIDRNLPHSQIPSIIHQTWKNVHIDTWSPRQRESAESWLTAAEEADMAYFLWDDYGVMELLEAYDPKFIEIFEALPVPVERADVFRILVTQWIGGIYADIDTEPLRSPIDWIASHDIQPWSDPETKTTYATLPHGIPDPPPSTYRPVSILLGVEADTDPKTDTYWRMGYQYPLQLTQWALASAPNHPILARFIQHVTSQLLEAASRHRGRLRVVETWEDLRKVDPISLTGPGAVTNVTRAWLTETTDLRWEALTGLQDGGKSKLVSDVLILPITAFSPGRGRYGNMGSKPFSDPGADLRHYAQNSWREFDIKVEYGKFCRSVFGRCRYWSKVPQHHWR